MAVTVTHIGNVITFASTAGTALSSVSIPFGSAVSVGTLLSVSVGRAVSSGQTPDMTIADDAGNTWTTPASERTSGNSATNHTAQCIVTTPITTSHDLDLGFNNSQARTIVTVEAFSISGGTANLAGKLSSSGDNTGTTYNVGTTASVTAPALAICTVAATGDGTDWNTLTGWTQLARSGTVTPTSAYRWTRQAWRDVTVTGTVSASGTLSASAANVGYVLAIPLVESGPPPTEGPVFAEWDGSQLVPLTAMEWDGSALVPLSVTEV